MASGIGNVHVLLEKVFHQVLTDTVERTYNTADNFGHSDTLHGVLGLIGEVGELADTVKRHQFYGLPLDEDNVLEEMGDVLYYFEALRLCFGLQWEDIIIHLREKLQKRYPSGFSSEGAVIRRDKTKESASSGKYYWNNPLNDRSED